MGTSKNYIPYLASTPLSNFFLPSLFLNFLFNQRFSTSLDAGPCKDWKGRDKLPSLSPWGKIGEIFFSRSISFFREPNVFFFFGN